MRRSFQRNVAADEARRKRNIIVISIFILAIMIFSVVGIAITNNSSSISAQNTITDTGYKFTSVDLDGLQTWQAKIDGKARNFLLLPSQVSYITVDEETRSAIVTAASQNGLAITANSSDQYVQFFNYGLYNLFVDYSDEKQVLIGTTSDADSQYSLLTCDMKPILDASNFTGPIVTFQIADENSITSNNGCIFVNGIDGQSILYSIERLRYLLLGVE